MECKFCFEDKRTRRDTHEMILMMAKHSDHGYRQNFNSDADVKRFFRANGHYWDDLVQKCRKLDEPIPLLPVNLLGGTWRISPGVRGAIVTGAATNEEIEVASVEGPGILITSNYLQLFENAVENFHKCMGSTSFGDFQSSISNGVASIEAYIAHRAWLYNSRQPSEKLVDSKENKVSFDTKIDEWVPKMSNGKKLDKSGQKWRDFKRLRAVRDELAIHIKQPSLGIEYQEFGELLNLLRSGIAGVLLDLHLLFSEPIPSRIIRYAYLPDIKLVMEKVE